MVKFKKILFPVDMSASSLKIVPYVKMIAELFESDIHLLYIARSMEHLSVVQIELHTLYSFQSEVVEKAKTSLEKYKEKHFGNRTNIKSTVRRGYPSEEILEYVSKEKIDLIIMGTHGRKGLDKVIFGSVAEQVVKTSPVPVLVVNPHKVHTVEIEPLLADGLSN